MKHNEILWKCKSMKTRLLLLKLFLPIGRRLEMSDSLLGIYHFFQGRYICRWALLVPIRFELNSTLLSKTDFPFSFSKFFCKSILIKESKLENKQTGWYYSNFSHSKGKSSSINQLFPVQQILKYRRPIFPHFSIHH